MRRTGHLFTHKDIALVLFRTGTDCMILVLGSGLADYINPILLRRA